MQRIFNASSSDAPVLGRMQEVTPSERAPASDAQADGNKDDYIIELATHLATDREFCLLWSALVATSNSHQKIYQTPEFFQFQRETCDGGERLEVLAIYLRSNHRLVGVMPVRLGRQELVFGIGRFVLYKTSVEMINLLGSVPAAPGGAALTQHFGLQVLSTFPQAKAILMQSVALNSAHWQSLEARGHNLKLSECALMGPWRECHTLPLPGTFEQYLEKFTAKKRYNLNRQIRQLAEQAGTLAMQRITRQDEVAQMMSALMPLVPPEQQGGILRPSTFEALARQNLLLCYVLRAGDEVAGAVSGIL